MSCRCPTNTFASAAAIGGLLLLSACQNKPGDSLGSVYVKKSLVNADFGAEVIVTSAESEALAGAGVIVPAAALKQPTFVNIAVAADAVYDDAVVAGPSMELTASLGEQELENFAFEKPVEIVVRVRDGVAFDRLRIYVQERSGERSVVLPSDIRYDAASHTAHFYAQHFTTYQAGEASSACSNLVCPTNDCSQGHCNTPCDSNTDCGPAPGVPTWTCEDGSVGGSTGECRRNADGSCGWVINWCDPACGEGDCPSPAPASPTRQCQDGTTAGPECRRSANGGCGWEITHCSEPCSNVTCENGTVCDPTTNACVPTSTPCGNNTCAAGQFCCNASCGICAGPDGACAQVECPHECGPNSGNECPAGFVCDGGRCVGQTTPCGHNTCGAGEYCCNESCGVCAPHGGACIQVACTTCGNDTCPPGEICRTDPNGGASCEPAACSANECGPAPGLPNWMCENGQTGGPTGACLRDPAGACYWEINWCPRTCAATDCGPPPTVNEPCANGTLASTVCSRDTNDGSCTWHRNCGP